jgi:hypothetical protein
VSGEADARAQHAQDYLRTFRDQDHGQRVLGDLMVFCGVNQTHYDDNAYRMAYRAGKYDVWLRIQAFLEFDPEQMAEVIRAYKRARIDRETRFE